MDTLNEKGMSVSMIFHDMLSLKGAGGSSLSGLNVIL